MKLERLLSIIYRLLNHEVVSAAELADRYGVSQRTIYRDIEAICAAGIPVVSYQGANGGYGIMKEYKMDKSLLGSDDIASLITLLDSASTVFQDERAQETIQRLKTVQTDNGRAPSLRMDLGSWRAYVALLRAIRASINAGRVVRFRYMNAKDEHQDRTVEPVSLVMKYGTWYLYGYCRTRRDYRVFKLTRMSELAELPDVFEPHPETRMDEMFPGGGFGHEQVEHAVIRFAAGSSARVLDEFYVDEKTFHEDGTLTLTIVEPIDAEWLIEKLLCFGEYAVVLEPPSLRQRMKKKIAAMLGRYEEV
ncbi:YafY family transcriptional regulator [Paenibacillus sp. MWE-103]|uniref:YafY family transcriptional regulator n=1 Tax=Paenibacillus artemisiicola TaxID=1172618 RepID=A0ABS3W7R9_9BACL|nr:YafY family transcriptional regulator [Paenibacillus artemisiicola]